MATFVKYQSGILNIVTGVMKLHAAGDTFKALLSNAAPNVATHTIRGDVTELGTANGYTSGGIDIQNDCTASGGTATMTAVDVVWTSVTGNMGPFRYFEIYDDTPTSPVDPMFAYVDYGTNVTLDCTAGETFTGDFGASLATFA